MGNGNISGDVRTVSLKAVDMYEDPVLVDKTFDVAGKKIGDPAYLLATSIPLSRRCRTRSYASSPRILYELILDLRYNGGGYAFTENVVGIYDSTDGNVLLGHILQRRLSDFAQVATGRTLTLISLRVQSNQFESLKTRAVGP